MMLSMRQGRPTRARLEPPALGRRQNATELELKAVEPADPDLIKEQAMQLLDIQSRHAGCRKGWRESGKVC